MMLLFVWTWKLIPPVDVSNLVGRKWIFRIKRHFNSSINKFKAQLVVKGFYRRPGVDNETFGLVFKPIIVRLVLRMVVSYG